MPANIVKLLGKSQKPRGKSREVKIDAGKIRCGLPAGVNVINIFLRRVRIFRNL